MKRPSRTYVASGHGTSMVFKTNPRGTVVWASPQFPRARGQFIVSLRAAMRSQGFAFYEVERRA